MIAKFLSSRTLTWLVPGALLSVFCASAVADPGVSISGKAPVLVELYTNQNCGACVAANKNLIELSEADDIFPITWSVPYWDYLGWKDTFAQPVFAERQKRYASHFNLRGRYTPQAIVDGCVQNTGLSEEAIIKKIQHARTPHMADIDLTMTEDKISLTAEQKMKRGAEVWVAGFIPGITEVIPTAGGNEGKILRHINVATSLSRLADWSGETPLTLDYECADKACLVIVQEQKTGDIFTFGVMPSGAGGEAAF